MAKALPKFSIQLFVDVKASDLQSALLAVDKRLTTKRMSINSFLDAENLTTHEEYGEGEIYRLLEGKSDASR